MRTQERFVIAMLLLLLVKALDISFSIKLDIMISVHVGDSVI